MSSKKQIRIEKKLVRESLSKERREEASQKALLFLVEACENRRVLSFASKPLELDLWPFNLTLLEKGCLLLPKVENNSLSIYLVKDLDSLILSKLGILEPDSEKCRRVPLSEVDLILVPGLAFDERGNRIGYGKGHFDRFLESSSHLKWGIGFLEEKVDSIPKESHDIILDEVHLF